MKGPKEVFEEKKERKIYEALDMLRTDTDIIPRNQKYSVYSCIEPDESVYDLFYCFCFHKFLKTAKGPIRKYILDSDNEFTKENIELIYIESDKFFREDLENFNKDIKISDAKIEETDLLIEKEKENNENDKRKRIMESHENIDKELKELEEEIEERKRFDELKIKERRRIRKRDNENKRENFKRKFFERLHKKINEMSRIKHEKNMEYLVHYFQKFMSLNRVVLDEIFNEEYDTECHRLIKHWGSFKSIMKANDFCRRIKNRAKMGKTYVQEAGTWQIYNPTHEILENTHYMNEQLDKVMSGYRDKINQAREEIQYRKELLKEKEMRDQGVEYRTYKRRDHNKIGKEVNKEDKQERSLKDVPDSIINRDFEFYNPRDHFELKLPSKDEIEDKKTLQDEIRETINTEIEMGNAHIVNPDMMHQLGMSEDKIEIVRRQKGIKLEEEFRGLNSLELEKNLKKIKDVSMNKTEEVIEIKEKNLVELDEIAHKQNPFKRRNISRRRKKNN
jgi:hypothetical protein